MQFSELYEYLLESDEGMEGMQSTILIFKQQVKELQSQLTEVHQEREHLRKCLKEHSVAMETRTAGRNMESLNVDSDSNMQMTLEGSGDGFVEVGDSLMSDVDKNVKNLHRLDDRTSPEIEMRTTGLEPMSSDATMLPLTTDRVVESNNGAPKDKSSNVNDLWTSQQEAAVGMTADSFDSAESEGTPNDSESERTTDKKDSAEKVDHEQDHDAAFKEKCSLQNDETSASKWTLQDNLQSESQQTSQRKDADSWNSSLGKIAVLQHKRTTDTVEEDQVVQTAGKIANKHRLDRSSEIVIATERKLNPFMHDADDSAIYDISLHHDNRYAIPVIVENTDTEYIHKKKMVSRLIHHDQTKSEDFDDSDTHVSRTLSSLQSEDCLRTTDPSACSESVANDVISPCNHQSVCESEKDPEEKYNKGRPCNSASTLRTSERTSPSAVIYEPPSELSNDIDVNEKNGSGFSKEAFEALGTTPAIDSTVGDDCRNGLVRTKESSPVPMETA